MGEAIGQMLPMAVGVAVSPMPIVAVVLMLVTPRARINGPTFLAGWILGIAVLGAVLLALAGPADPSDKGEPATWVDAVKLALGALLILLAAKSWRGRPREGDELATPKWMSAVDRFSPVKAFATAAALGSVNPKNLVFIVGGVAAVAQTDISGGQQALAWVIFTVIASLGVALPVGIYFVLGDRAPALLERLKDWMARNNGVIIGALCLIIGVKLTGDAIAGFAS